MRHHYIKQIKLFSEFLWYDSRTRQDKELFNDIILSLEQQLVWCYGRQWTILNLFLFILATPTYCLLQRQHKLIKLKYTQIESVSRRKYVVSVASVMLLSCISQKLKFIYDFLKDIKKVRKRYKTPRVIYCWGAPQEHNNKKSSTFLFLLH